MNSNDNWLEEVWAGQVRHGLKVTEHLHQEQSRFQTIQVADTEAYGRVLMLDGLFQTSEVDEHYYHEMLVHPALVSAPAIDRVLVIGGGDGGTVREVLRHPEVREAIMVEIDERVVAVCKQLLPSIGTAFDDPRLELLIDDGVRYVTDACAASFDIIVLDGSDPIGPSEGLFGEGFYANVLRALKPDGVFVLQSESYNVMRDLYLAIQASLGKIFPSVRPYFGYAPLYGTGMWTWTHASRGVDPLAIVDSRAEAVERVTRYYHRGVHRGAFALPNELRRRES